MAEPIRIACLGDTMPGGILHYELGKPFCGEDLMSKLRKADIRVATLETAIGDEPTFDEEKMRRDKDVIYCPMSDLYRLVELNINVVSLANNHAFDLGADKIEHTIRELDKLGIKCCGAGRNIKEASEPAVVTVNGKTIAFIAFCDNNPGTCGYIPAATATSPGINVMDSDNIRGNITRLRGKYDYLFVMMHWGKEYYYYPTPEVNTLSREIIDWGADGVIGSHSHQIQPTTFYRGKPIIFSLGNFFFPDRIITEPRSTYYPDKAPDFHRLPSTDGYPMVSEPTFKRWKDVARKGQVITLVFSDRSIKAEREFTCLDKQSHIDCCDYNPPLLFRLSHFMVKIPFYKLLFFGARACRFIRKKAKGEL